MSARQTNVFLYKTSRTNDRDERFRRIHALSPHVWTRHASASQSSKTYPPSGTQPNNLNFGDVIEMRIMRAVS